MRRPRFRRRSRSYVAIATESELSEERRRELDAERAFRASLTNVYAVEAGGPYTCPCCGHRTLPSRGRYDLCPECDWEDDGQDDHDSDVIRRGPNGSLSLDAARLTYRDAGGRAETHRAPRPAEPD